MFKTSPLYCTWHKVALRVLQVSKTPGTTRLVLLQSVTITEWIMICDEFSTHLISCILRQILLWCCWTWRRWTMKKVEVRKWEPVMTSSGWPASSSGSGWWGITTRIQPRIINNNSSQCSHLYSCCLLALLLSQLVATFSCLRAFFMEYPVLSLVVLR